MDKRYLSFLAFNAIILLIWIVVLFTIELFDPYDFSGIIRKRLAKRKEILIPFRGNIYDRNGELLATSKKMYQIDFHKNVMAKKFKSQMKSLKKTKDKYVKKNQKVPKKILDSYSSYKSVKEVRNKAIEILATNTDLSKKSLRKKMSHKSNVIFISDKVSENNLYIINKEMKKYKISGLYPSFVGMERIYPKSSIAARLLGIAVSNNSEFIRRKSFAKATNNEIIKSIGITGIEKTFNKELQGEFGYREVFVNGARKNVYYNNLKENKEQNGNSIYLTIDYKLQAIVEKEIKKGLKKYEAKMGMAVIMNPKTGEILAMTGIQKTDEKMKAGTIRTLSNLPVSATFEPGSTMKPVTALLAIEKKDYNGNEKIDCRKYHIGNRIISDVHEYHRLTLKEIIAHSSNVGISKVAERVGKEALYERLIDLGFGHPTGSDIANESGGTLRELNRWRGYSLQSISFGQEMSVTALQLANAYCAIANGGKVMKPLIAKKIVDENDKVIKEFKPTVLTKISDKKSLDTLKSYLKAVVDFGTSVGTKTDFMTVAGKTGTAEKKGKIGYSKERYTSDFAGFFPVEDPRYVMVILYDEPNYYKKYYYAAQSAVPTFKNIMLKIINMPQNDVLAKVQENNKNFVKMPNLIGKNVVDAISILGKKHIEYSLINKKNNSIVINQYPAPNVFFDKSQKSKIVFGKDHSSKIDVKVSGVPNFVGKTIIEAQRLAKYTNIRLKVLGNGIVKQQSMIPGTKIKVGAICKLTAK